MKLNNPVVLVIFCALPWIRPHCSLSCARTFLLQREKVKRLVLIDQRSDLPLAPLFDTTDWSITISKDTNAGFARETYPEFDVIITTSVATFSNSTINLMEGRVYVILSDEHPTIDAVSLALSKFEKTARSNVIIIAKIDKPMWHFYRFTNFDCTKNSAESVVAFAECDENQSGNITFLKMTTKINGKKCPIIVAAMESQPFICYDESGRLYKGIDYFLVKNIAQQLQIDLSVIRADINSTKCVFCDKFFS